MRNSNAISTLNIVSLNVLPVHRRPFTSILHILLSAGHIPYVQLPFGEDGVWGRAPIIPGEAYRLTNDN